jgi:hypothetical protein
MEGKCKELKKYETIENIPSINKVRVGRISCLREEKGS